MQFQKGVYGEHHKDCSWYMPTSADPSNLFSNSKKRYFISFIDDYSRGGEFTSHEFNVFCKANGISRQLTAVYTPQQNGVVERKNRTIMNIDWGRSNEEARIDILEWGNSNEEGSEHDQSEEESKEEVAAKEEGGEVSLSSSESPGENSPTSEESSPEGRNKRVPFWMEDYVNREEFSEEEVEHNNLILFTSTIDSTTFEEVVQSSKWRAAIDLEIEAIERNETWELAYLPKGMKKIGSVYQLDVKSAFLHGELNEAVFVEQPQGYEKKGEEYKVYKLKKALYGLKQAPCAWYNWIEAYFVNEGFESVKNPIVPGVRLMKDEEGAKVNATMYKQLVGSLMHLIATRPDLIYLKGIVDLEVFYRMESNGELIAYTDSDYAGNVDDRKNTNGYVFLISEGVVSWSLKKQHVVALSTTETEFMAATSCAYQGVWMRRVLEKLGHSQGKCTTMLCDNSSTIKLSKNLVMHGRSKHIDVRFHFLRDLTRDGVVELKHCVTQEQVADIMTKSLKLDVLLKLHESMGVCVVPRVN
ncbi:Retrovirus-related Pol polyprotein from transposon TNT 1-94 [Vitis vinifera]|uniref:Retrovirus-related Pol polyprotein from transposon TNT 1-94 n=1 Tax=Vitis vinifera TaxID=29760 RepID=A0A438J9Z2_VITVI|nr:Retrovirus-related Pol polyprotein from transposon TNT 1-94 [Vitis vinifera]